MHEKPQRSFVSESVHPPLDDSRITFSGKFSPDMVCKNLVDKSIDLLNLVNEFNGRMKAKKLDLTTKIEQTEIKFQDLKSSQVL